MILTAITLACFAGALAGYFLVKKDYIKTGFTVSAASTLVCLISMFIYGPLWLAITFTGWVAWDIYDVINTRIGIERAGQYVWQEVGKCPELLRSLIAKHTA